MVIEPDMICELDFQKYVYEELLLAAKKVQLGGMLGRKKLWIHGCLIGLQVNISIIM
jgi:hypothetical protein